MNDAALKLCLILSQSDQSEGLIVRYYYSRLNKTTPVTNRLIPQTSIRESLRNRPSSQPIGGIDWAVTHDLSQTNCRNYLF